MVAGAEKTALSNASVFIRGTSKGTVSATDGSFALHNIPKGIYELVISSVGYATVVHTFSTDSIPQNIIIELTLKATELDAVTVDPYDEATWAEWGQFFLDNFVGTSAAARNTRILNQKAIRFRHYRKKGLLVAFADEPLIIENRALGYRIKYQLEDFIWNPKEQSIIYLGYELFEDMAEEKKRIPKAWVDNRRKAYLGSMNHFCRALYTNRLREESFVVRRLEKKRNTEKDRIREIYALQAKRAIKSGGTTVIRLGSASPIIGAGPGTDSSGYYESVIRQPDYIDVYGPDILTADSLVTVRNDSSRVLFFPNYLHIMYTGAKEEKEFLQKSMQSRKPYHQVSSVFLQSGTPVVIEKNGLYYPAAEVFALGYWAWSEKVSHLLPLEYEPDK